MDRRIMLNSTYNPQTWIETEASKVAPNTLGITGAAGHGTITTIDTLVSDDNFIRAIEFICKDQVFGDKITIQVIDIDNTKGYGANFVLATPVSNYNLSEDRQRQGGYEAVIPKKIPGGTYFRITYTSVGAQDVEIKLNLFMLKALV